MKIINSFKYAMCGIVTTFKEETNMKIHVLMTTLVIIFGIILKISKWEWIICIILFGLVIFAEITNTAIENMCNMIEPNKNKNIKKIKDMSAGAVLINAVVAAIIGLIIFLPKLLK